MANHDFRPCAFTRSPVIVLIGCGYHGRLAVLIWATHHLSNRGRIAGEILSVGRGLADVMPKFMTLQQNVPPAARPVLSFCAKRAVGGYSRWTLALAE